MIQVALPRQYSASAVSIARGASYALIQTVLTNVALVLSFAILARLITPAEMGILVPLSLVIGFTQTVVASALRQATTKFVAETLPNGGSKGASPIFYQSIRMSFLQAAVLGLGIFLLAPVLSNQLLRTSTGAIYFQVLGFDVLVYAGVLPTLVGALFGFHKFKEAAIIGTLGTLIRQSLIIILIIWLRSFVGLVIAWVVSDSATAFLYAVYLSRLIGRPRFDFPLGRILSFSWPLSLSYTANFAYSWFDSAVLLVFVPLTTLGVYNVVSTAFSVLVGISLAISTTLFPAYSTIQGPDQRRSLNNASQLAARYVNFVMIPLSLGLLATAKPALSLFVGEAYVEGSLPLMVLSGSFAITAVATALTPIIVAIGQTRVSSGITTISVALSVITAILLVPFLGMIGASVARGLGMFIVAALTILYLERKLDFHLCLEPLIKNLGAGAVMVTAILLIQVPMYNKFLLPLYAFVGAIVYFTMLRLLKAVRQDDIDLLTGFFGNRLDFATDLLRRVLLPVKQSGRPEPEVK